MDLEVFSIGNTYYVDPTSLEKVELGTRNRPFRDVQSAIAEIFNQRSASTQKLAVRVK